MAAASNIVYDISGKALSETVTVGDGEICGKW